MAFKTPVLELDKESLQNLPVHHLESYLLDWFYQEKVSLMHFCNLMRSKISQVDQPILSEIDFHRQHALQHLQEMRQELGKFDQHKIKLEIDNRITSLEQEVHSILAAN